MVQSPQAGSPKGRQWAWQHWLRRVAGKDSEDNVSGQGPRPGLQTVGPWVAVGL